MLHLILCTALFVGFAESKSENVAAVDVERAARDFRIQVYETFRLDRPEYDQRREAGDRLLEEFTAAGSPADKQDAVLEWFQTAADVSRPDDFAPLPELPVMPAPLPENVAREDDPTTAPHLPALDRQPVEMPTSLRPPGSQDTSFLGSPTPVDAHADDVYHGPSFTPPSRILRSIQRALISSAADTASGSHEDNSQDGWPVLPQDPADATLPNSAQPLDETDPFAPGRIDGDQSLFPAIDEPGN